MTITTIRRLYLMQVAYLPERNTPFVCYLVQTDDGANILIDSGLPMQIPEGAAPPGVAPPDMSQNVIAQLASIGLQPKDIRTFVVTHFDGDHTGNNDLFPDAEFIAQRTLYEDAQTSRRAARSRDHWGKPGLRYRLVDGDTTLVPGLELIETSGHVPGHQSVLVRLPETGVVILAIDAVSVQQAWSRDRVGGPADENGEQAIASTRKLIDLAEREQVALIVFGHDGTQWASLRKLPEYYS